MRGDGLGGLRGGVRSTIMAVADGVGGMLGGGEGGRGWRKGGCAAVRFADRAVRRGVGY